MDFEVPQEGGITPEDGDWKVMIIIHTLATDTSFSQPIIDTVRGMMLEGWQVI